MLSLLLGNVYDDINNNDDHNNDHNDEDDESDNNNDGDDDYGAGVVLMMIYNSDDKDGEYHFYNKNVVFIFCQEAVNGSLISCVCNGRC